MNTKTSRKIVSYISCALLDAIYRFFTPVSIRCSPKKGLINNIIAKYPAILITGYLIISIYISNYSL